MDAVATAAERQSVALNEYRYTLPPDASFDLSLGQQSCFDFQGSRLYTDASTLACEEAIMAARNDDGGPTVDANVVMDALVNALRPQRPSLHTDQRAAVADVVLSGNRLDAIVGPAGTGKTTTLGVVKTVWEAEYGAGSVVGLAPAAASADVLGRELGMATENVSKWLHESMGRGAGMRAERFLDVQARLADAPNGERRSIAYAQEATRLAATQHRWSFHQNQLVVVDEASMVSTFQLAALVQQAEDAGAKILLVGDPSQLDSIDAGGVLGWLDRQGRTSRLSTIWRFHEEWERTSSLKLRTGDYSAIPDYEQHQRIRHGTYLNMLDMAYLAWQADSQVGKSSILIAADNETVGMLNERAQADLVGQGTVDAELTVHLADGLRAGAGDTIIARGNNRRLIDSEEDFVRNGTLYDVQTVHRDGSVLAARRETGARVVLPRTYLESHVELGYATTTHRSQGITVDTGHTVVTQGRLTRELLYVSMTRGRSGNFAYVSEGDDFDHPAVDPSLQLSWRSILAEVLAAEGAERSAHEVLESEQLKSDSLERLYAEYDYLAQIAASHDLLQCLKNHSPGSLPELDQSPSWGAAVAAWRKATAVSHQGAEAVLVRTLQNVATAKDPVAVLSTRLRQSVRGIPTAATEPLFEVLEISRPDLAALVDQVRARIRQRTGNVTMAALVQDPEWKSCLDSLVGSGAASGELIREIAVYRDRWGVSQPDLPLGSKPADYEWEQLSQWERLQVAIAGVRGTPMPYEPATRDTDFPLSSHALLTSAGWQL